MWVISTLILLTAFLIPPSAWADDDDGLQDEGTLSPVTINVLYRWNKIAIDATGFDHAPGVPGEGAFLGEQLGPGRSSRALAIVHIAIFDAVNAIAGGYRSYTGLSRTSSDTSMDAAIAQAAHDTLVAMYPAQRARLDRALAADLAAIREWHTSTWTKGVELGRRSAARILALRANDGAQHAEPRVGIDFFVSAAPGKWQPDPVSGNDLALGAYWGNVRPFVLASGSQFRVPPPPGLATPAYARAFNEVKRLGGDGVSTPTLRTAEQTAAGVYWGYDGTPVLGSPPRLYNQVVRRIALQMRTPAVELARLLALVNVAVADAAIAIWESKYYYQFWRPVTGIREADAGTGPTGWGDGNPETFGDVTFTPLGAQSSNLRALDFTPPFPAYPSGHAGFGGAVFQVLRRFYRTDQLAFTFVSDELNGVTRDNDGSVRPFAPRRFSSLSQAEEENGRSRIYLGIHWEFDRTWGTAQGRHIADYVFSRAFYPRRDPDESDEKEHDEEDDGARE